MKKATLEQRQMAEFLCHGDVRETRDEGVNPVVFTNYNGNLGTFVPTEFLTGVVAALKQHSPLFDIERVSYLETTHGRPIQAPWLSDVNNVAAVITEGTTDTEQDIASIAQAFIKAYTYRTPMIRFSYEAEQDIPAWSDYFTFVLADRIARGAGADLLLGNGIGKTLGLIPSIQALGATFVAKGSAVNDGSSNTGVNSVGVQDLSDLFFKIPAPYRNSPKFAFMMNSSTANFVSKLLDKSGRPLLDQQHNQMEIYKKPVLIDESMSNIGALNFPVIAGDFSRWVTRVCVDQSMKLKRYTQAPGLVENGEFGVRMFVRVDGILMHGGDSNAPSPIWALQNHS